MLSTTIGLVLTLQTSPIRVVERVVEQRPVRVVEINTRDPRVRIGLILADGFPGADEPFDQMVKRAKPAAAINGTYFDKFNLNPIGDLVQDGQLKHSGRMGTAFSITPEGEMDIRRVVRHRTMRWEGFETVLACGPALVLDGQVDVDAEGEGFRSPAVVGHVQRMGLGFTRDGRLLLVHIRQATSFEAMAKVFLALGCHEAMNLDAGASLAMFVKGKTYARPGRKLTNALAVWLDGS